MREDSEVLKTADSFRKDEVPGHQILEKKSRKALHSPRSLFSNFSFPGFCRLRMHNKGGAPVAFVEYQVSTDSVPVLRAGAVGRFEKKAVRNKLTIFASSRLWTR